MGGAMQRLFTLCSFILISLFLLSADKFSCQPNAKLDNTSANSYLEYFPIDGSNNLIRTYTPGYPEGVNEYMITTDTYVNKYIKNASLPLGYNDVSQGNQTGIYFVVNRNYLNTLIDQEIYKYYDEPDRDEVIHNAQTILNAWIGNPVKPTNAEVFNEPVFIYAEDADFGTEPLNHTYEFPQVITKAFYAKKTDVYNNGSRLIIETLNSLDVYDYDKVIELQDNAKPITYINLKNTVDIKKNIPNKLQ